MKYVEQMAKESLMNVNLALYDVCNVVFAKIVMGVMPWRKHHMGVELAVEGMLLVMC